MERGSVQFFPVNAAIYARFEQPGVVIFTAEEAVIIDRRHAPQYKEDGVRGGESGELVVGTFPRLAQCAQKVDVKFIRRLAAVRVGFP